MKNIKHLCFILIGLLTVAFISCKGSATGSFTGSDKKPLTISITSNENIKLFDTSRKANRTIVADAFTTGDGLVFYLWGTAQSDQTLAPKVVDVTPDKIGPEGSQTDDPYNGKVILDIDCYNWELTLAACPPPADPSNFTPLTDPDDIMDEAVLVGYGNVDMLFTNNIKFTLSPKGLHKTGKVNLTLQLEEIDDDNDNQTADVPWPIPDGYTATAYIYNIVTGEPVKSHSNEDLFIKYFNDADSDTVDDTLETRTAFEGGASFNANNKEIDPGTYSFQVEFTKKGELRKYVWNDTLIILPGTEVQKTIIIPNLVGTKPEAPSAFNVSFNDNEETEFKNHYSVHFTWTQTNVVNETNFALELVELKGDEDIATTITNADDFDAIWNDATKYNNKYTFDYLHNVKLVNNGMFYKSGSLFANSTSLDIYLELGKRYIARLYSENNAGYSDDAVYITTITPPANVLAESGTLSTINRYRVKYYNQGGKWNTGGAKTSDTDTLPKIYYWSQTNNNKPYTVLNPVKQAGTGLGTTALPYLYNGAADWIYWVTNLSTGEKYPDDTGSTYSPDPYSDYKNLDLYAMFSREAYVNFYKDTDYDIVDTVADYVAGFGITAANLSSVNTNVASKTTLGYNKETNPEATTTVTVTLPSTTTWNYDSISLSISYGGYVFYNGEITDVAAVGTANTFTFKLKQLPSGLIYNCKVEAQHAMTTVSYPFTIYLTD